MTYSALEVRRSSPSMRALVFDGGLRLGQLPRPEASETQVIARVDACAISRMDLDFVEGRRPVQVRPTVLGHEFVGTVESIGARVDSSWMGKRVIARAVPGCNRCISCRQQLQWLCEEGRGNGLGMGLVDGAFAEYIAVEASTLVAVDELLDDDEATLAYSVATALEVVAAIKGEPPQRVLVVGDGNIGLLITLVLHAAGHSVSVLGRHPSRRDLLWRSGIAFQAAGDGILDEADEWARLVGEPCGVVVECSGRLSGFELASRALRARGQLIMVSDHVGQPGSDLRSMVRQEIELIGVGGGPLQPALDYLGSRVIDVLPLVEYKSSLQEGVEAFQHAGHRGTLRTILLRGPGNQ